MSPSLLSILFNIGKIVATFKDAEAVIADAVAKKSVTADLKQLLSDVAGLVGAGLIGIPGMTADQVSAVVAELLAL